MNFYRLFPALTLSLILTACGGGGGGGGGGGSTATVASTSTFQIKTAYVNDFTTASSVPFTASGTTSGTPFTGSGTVTTGAPRQRPSKANPHFKQLPSSLAVFW